MERISVTEAARNLPQLLDRIASEGICVELERAGKVIARLSPACSPSLSVRDLNRVFAQFPCLGEEAESFAKDLEMIRKETPREADPWA